MQNPKKILVPASVGIFVLEMSAQGLYSVRFPPFPRNAQRSQSFSISAKLKLGPSRLSLIKRKQKSGRATINVKTRDEFVAPDKKCLFPLFRKLRDMRLDLSGFTPFQREVYTALRKVPAGKAVTYGELAKRAGYPGAARAVGTAMKKNRLPIVIPCHRVVPASGGTGAYSAGIQWKRFLLEYEKQKFTPRKFPELWRPKQFRELVG